MGWMTCFTGHSSQLIGLETTSGMLEGGGAGVNPLALPSRGLHKLPSSLAVPSSVGWKMPVVRSREGANRLAHSPTASSKILSPLPCGLGQCCSGFQLNVLGTGSRVCEGVGLDRWILLQ